MGNVRRWAGVSGYQRALAMRTRWRRASEGVFDGLWLGLLDDGDLREVDRAYYAGATETVDGVPRTYAEQEHILQGLAPWEASALSGLDAGLPVVVTSAGAGREVQGLLDLGFDARGFEPNEALVRAGRGVLREPSRLEQCAYDTFPAFAGRAGGVVIGWGSYMLIRGRDRRTDLLRGAAAALVPGGLLLVSYFDRPPTRYFATVAAVAGPIRRLRGGPPVEHGDALSPNFVHYFTPSEVANELADAGFDVVRSGREPYGHTLARRR